MAISDLAHNSEELINHGLNNPGPFTIFFIFLAGLITSLGPCSISLLPVTLAYLAGFSKIQEKPRIPFIRSFSFSFGIVLAFVLLGSISALLGQIYGQISFEVSNFVAIVAVLMGLNLLGLLKIPLPNGPDPEVLRNQVPNSLGPLSAGLAFGLASSPCTTPVLAVLLAWISKSNQPLLGIGLLISFGVGQVIPLFIAGTAAENVSKLLALKPFFQWIPLISGAILISTGCLTLLSNWI